MNFAASAWVCPVPVPDQSKSCVASAGESGSRSGQRARRAHASVAFVNSSRALALFLAVLVQQAQASVQDDLLGCWKTGKIVQIFGDGSRASSQPGRCTLQYKRDDFVSTCTYSQTPVTSTYRYNVVRPGVYEATMTSSSLRTELLGTTREYEFKVKGPTLSLTARPKVTGAQVSATIVRVESESEKTLCGE